MPKKKLSEMNLEELWQLFPIRLTAWQACWKEWYSEESGRLKGLFSNGETVSHIGSTAIPNIWAKPIIDILVEVPKTSVLTDYTRFICDSGYILMSQSENRLSFNKGYTEDGFAERVFHLHLRYDGDNDELYFRDYLTDFPKIAKEYENLKLALWKAYEHNRDAYTQAKTEFVQKHTEQAKTLYGNRHARF